MPAWAAGRDVQRSALQLGEELGRGGQGSVMGLTGERSGLVFKRYNTPGANPAALKGLVDLPASLPSADRDRLLRQATWPLHRVIDHGNVAGSIMQKIPDQFYGHNSMGRRTARELQHLLYEPNPTWGDLVTGGVDSRTRLAIVRQSVALFGLLHGRALVVGDISMMNILWAPGDPPAILLIDCDGIRRLGSRSVLPQPQTVDWNDPLQPAGGPDLDTDRYKVAMLVGRVLCRDPGLRPGSKDDLPLIPGIPDGIAAAVRAQWRQAAQPRGRRPDAWHWMRALSYG